MKKYAYSLLAALLLVTLTGCSVLRDVPALFNGDEAVANAQAKQYVWFSKDDTLGNEEDLRLTVEAFAEYALSYGAYHSTLLYNTLTKSEQTLYRALAFALEQGYTLVAVDAGLQLGVEQCADVLLDFSLDSPLVEQNLWYATGECSAQYPVSVLGLHHRAATFYGSYVVVENFAKVWWSKKVEAISAAEQIVAQMPQNLTEAKRAEWLYRYLVEHTEYYNYDGAGIDQIQPYLYDALVTGKTHCDGLTNGLGLLYNIAGITCAEKIFFAGDEEEVGHTWNVFKAGEHWYNADATGRDTLPKSQTGIGAGLHFAYADVMQEYTPYSAERYPVCGQSLYMPVDAHLQSVAGNGFIQAIEQGYNAHNHVWALVVADSCPAATLKAQIQKLANRWGQTVNWITFPLAGGRTAILVHREGLF